MAHNLTYNKNQIHKTLDFIQKYSLLNFDFIEMGLGIVSPPHFVYYFSKKMFFTLYFISWPHLIVWLPLLLDILGKMCIAIVCYPGCDVVGFEIKRALPNQAVFLREKNVKTKNEISWKRKELLMQNKTRFSSHLKGFQLQKIVSDLKVRL